MDLPKALLQKTLPKKGGKEQGAAAKAPNASAMPLEDASSEDELFLQAMQGRVKPPRSKKTTNTPGSFPLHERAAFTNMLQKEHVKVTLEPDAAGQAPLASSVPPKDGAATQAEQRNGAKGAEGGEEGAQDFALAMRTVKALKGKGRDIAPEVEAADAAIAQGKNAVDLLDKEIVFDVHVAGDGSVQAHVVGLDEQSFLALSSGLHSPEARLDLHGMNANQAFQALVPFFRMAWHKGLRTLIVVTGRGTNSPTGMAVLRHKLQTWLTQEPFRRVVMAFCTARPCDGGMGSMYVLLRKYRKKHKVYWDRYPADSDLFEDFSK